MRNCKEYISKIGIPQDEYEFPFSCMKSKRNLPDITDAAKYPTELK